MKVKCDKRGHEFELKPHDIKIRQQGELQIQYFRCPVCNEVYISLVTDKHLRRLIARENLCTGLMKKKAIKEARAYAEKANLKDKVDKHLL